MQNLGAKFRRKTPLGRTRHRWEDNIKIDVREIGRVFEIALIWLRKWTSVGL
jgi:hypothetical protein